MGWTELGKIVRVLHSPHILLEVIMDSTSDLRDLKCVLNVIEVNCAVAHRMIDQMLVSQDYIFFQFAFHGFQPCFS